MNNYRLVLVEWKDSYGVGSSWQSVESEMRLAPLICKSVGWVVNENDECLLIVPHVAIPHEDLSRPDGEKAETDGCGDMTIPKCSVVKVVDWVAQ